MALCHENDKKCTIVFKSNTVTHVIVKNLRWMWRWRPNAVAHWLRFSIVSRVNSPWRHRQQTRIITLLRLLVTSLFISLGLYKKENPTTFSFLSCAACFSAECCMAAAEMHFSRARARALCVLVIYLYFHSYWRLAPIMKMHLAGRDTIVLAAAFYRSAFGAHSENTTHTLGVT